MHQSIRALRVGVLLGAIHCSNAVAQETPTILTIDVENWVSYIDDVSDVTRRALSTSATPPTASRNFQQSVDIADIVAVNGQPAKGVAAFQSRTVRLIPNSTPGAAIADLGRGSIVQYSYEILQSDGTPIGSIMTSGFGGGPRTPGAPLAVTAGNMAIIGGTGAFVGARGQAGLVFSPGSIELRSASMAEDPAARRSIGGGKVRYVVHLIPQSRPEIILTPGGPAVAHSNDFTLVTAAKPAAPGETLSLFAKGLGPTRPGVDPGRPFPNSPIALVNSPVEVTVNGGAAEVLAAVGYPGATDAYQVNLRLPSTTPRGVASIQLTAAWIAGSVVTIPVQ